MRLCRIDMSWYLRWKGQWRCHRSSTRKSLWKFQRLKSRSLEKRVWHDATQCDTSFYLWDVFTRPRCLQVSIWHPCIVPCIVMYPCVVMRVFTKLYSFLGRVHCGLLTRDDDCWGAHPPGGLFHVVPGFWSISRLPHCLNPWLENASRCCTYDFYVFLKSWSSQVPVPVIQYIVQNSDFTSHYDPHSHFLWTWYTGAVFFADMDIAEKHPDTPVAILPVDVFRTNPCQSGACELWRKSFHVLKSFTRSTVQETSGFFLD